MKMKKLRKSIGKVDALAEILHQAYFEYDPKVSWEFSGYRNLFRRCARAAITWANREHSRKESST